MASLWIFVGDFHPNCWQASHKTSTIPLWKHQRPNYWVSFTSLYLEMCNYNTLLPVIWKSRLLHLYQLRLRRPPFWKFLTCENSCVTTSGNQAKQPVEPWKRRKMAVWVLFFFWPFCFAEEILLLDVVDNGNWSTFSDVDTLLAI